MRYNIRQIFTEMEDDLIRSMKRNLASHETEEEKHGFKWTQWQARKLAGLKAYQKRNRKIVESRAAGIEEEVSKSIRSAFRMGAKSVGDAAKKLWNKFGFGTREDTPRPIPREDDDANFFGVNERRMKALEGAAKKELREARRGVLRKMDDVYRQTIFKAQVYHNSGAASLGQAVDMATREFLDKGIDSITFSDGRKMNIASYAEMSLRTAAQRATFEGAGAKRNELGIRTVVVSAHNNCSDLCLPWQGKVYIDDVYSGGKASDGTYPLLSTAMDAGLFHPNCRHNMATFIPGASRLPTPVDDEKALANYDAEQHQRYLERQIRRYKRREAGSVDPENEAKAKAKVKEWQGRLKEHLGENEHLRRDSKREKSRPGERDSPPKDLYKQYKERLGADLPDRETFDRLRASEDWKLVQLDYRRRGRLLANPELTLPNAGSVTAADAKFTGYIFNPDNPIGWAKGVEFDRRLGYNSDNWKELQEQMLQRAKQYPATRKAVTEHGEKWEQQQIIYGPNGRPSNVVIGWHVKDGTKMSTAYIRGVKDDGES